MPKNPGFKGNKQSLSQKPCAVCGLAMTWRKSWAKNWDSVLYCSERCRADKSHSTSKPSPLAKDPA